MFKVGADDEYRRIAELDEIEYSEADVADIIRAETERYRTPAGMMAKAQLLPDQAMALHKMRAAGGLLGPIEVGGGKAQPVDEPVLTPGGWRRIGDLVPGDQVIGSDGSPTTVTGTYPQGKKPVVEVVMSDGTSARCCWDHLWTVVDRNGRVKTRTIRELRSSGLHRDTSYGHKYALPSLEPVQYPEADLPVDPYTLGALIGDGGLTTGTPAITSMDPEIIHALVLPPGVTAKAAVSDSSGMATTYYLSGPGRKPNPLTADLRALGLMGKLSHEKTVPAQYMQASVTQRLAFLQGLFDTDGSHKSAGRVDFSTSSRVLSHQVKEMVLSLGGSCRWTWAKTTHRPRYRLSLVLPDYMNPFQLPRKAEPAARGRQRSPRRWISDVREMGDAECVCISVDAPDHLYVTKDHILTHNTLTSFLAGEALGAKRPVLVVPGNLLKHKTRSELDEYLVQWRFREPTLVSYEALGKPQNENLLEDLAPDVLVMDECFMAKNKRAAVVKRLARYVRQHPEVKVVALGASIMTRALTQIAHLSDWALRSKSPIPRKAHSLEQWHLALSEGVPPRSRIDPGVLLDLAEVPDQELQEACRLDPNADPELIQARLAVRHKLNRSPGVVISRGKRPDCALNIWGAYPDVSVMRPHFKRLREDLIAIDDYQHESPMLLWSLARQCAMGFEYTWSPRPPESWLRPRQAWGAFVRQQVGRPHSPYDSAGVVERAVRSGELNDGGLLAAWKAVEGTFEINQEAVWVSDVMIDWAAAWMAKRENKNALVWTDLSAFGRRLSKRTGVKYFGQGGLCADLPIEQHSGPAILSVAANYKGRNLQRWSKMLIVSMTPTGMMAEQLLGRCHRRGQLSDCVDATVVIACREHWDGWQKMVRDARYTNQTQGLEQRLLYATIDVQRPKGLL